MKVEFFRKYVHGKYVSMQHNMPISLYKLIIYVSTQVFFTDCKEDMIHLEKLI